MSHSMRSRRSATMSAASWDFETHFTNAKGDDIRINARPVSTIGKRPTRIGVPAEAYMSPKEQQQLRWQRAKERTAEQAVAYGVGCSAGTVELAGSCLGHVCCDPAGAWYCGICASPFSTAMCAVPNALCPSCIGLGGAAYLHKHGKLDETMSRIRTRAYQKHDSPERPDCQGGHVGCVQGPHQTGIRGY